MASSSLDAKSAAAKMQLGEAPATEALVEDDRGEHTVENELFRPEAIQHSLNRLRGEVIVAIPPGLRACGLLAVAVVAIAIVFATTASYSRKETVTGWLQPEAGLIRAAAIQGGVVDAVSVVEGDVVAAGAGLARVRLAHDIDGGQAGDLLQASLAAESQANKDALAAELAKLALRRERLRDEKQHHGVELDEARARISMAEERLSLSELDEARTAKLVEEGALPRLRLEQVRATVLGAKGQVSASKTQIFELEDRIESAVHELAGLASEEAQLAARADLSNAQIAQRTTSAASQTVHVIKAPVAGQVLALPVELGQPIQSGGTIAVLSPVGSSLIAELYVPSRAAGFIREGQEVKLMYAAFPHQKFGRAPGVVSSITQAVLSPGDVPLPGIDLREPVFLVRVALEKQTLSAYGETLPLQPGMLLSADVVIDRRSLFEWVLDPLYAAVGR